jgi:hypothetical protein
MTEPKTKTTLNRRTLFAGAGTVGALAAATAALPLVREAEPVATALPKAPDQGGGYQLTEHVQHYYRTARI